MVLKNVYDAIKPHVLPYLTDFYPPNSLVHDNNVL